jgi:hypothetical protein
MLCRSLILYTLHANGTKVAKGLSLICSLFKLKTLSIHVHQTFPKTKKGYLVEHKTLEKSMQIQLTYTKKGK